MMPLSTTKQHGEDVTAGQRLPAEWSIENRPEEGQTMTDAATKKPIRVSTDGTAGPYIMVPVSQLDEIRRLLDGRGVSYWVEENAISLNGAPEVAVIDLGRGGDAAAVQTILDSSC
jgi:hypothetical protein